MSDQLSRRVVFAVAASLGASAHAAIYTVGTGAGCTHGTIQSAISAADSSAGADTVRLTRSLTYEPEANTINTTQELTVEGGYATCTSAADTTNTIVSGAGGAHAPVFTISAPTGALIHLRRLTISGGDVDGSGSGGGIRFEGDGILDIADSSITQNVAGYGGGIHAHGTGSNAELVIGANVLVVGNTAHYDGGGIYSSELELSMTAPGSTIFNNEATGVASEPYTGGHGGGLYIQAAGRSSYAYVGSGLAGIGAIALNSARYGGGVALGGANDEPEIAELQLFTTDPAHPARIGSNSASIAGGAFHAKAYVDSLDGSVDANVRIWNAVIDDNIAPDGAVAFLEGDDATLIGTAASFLAVDVGSPPAGGVPCAPGADCGRIDGNSTRDAGNNPTDGALIRGTVRAYVNIVASSWSPAPPARAGVVIANNSGGSLYRHDGSGGLFQAANMLVAANQFSRELVGLGEGAMIVHDSTIAGNTIGAGHLFATGSSNVEIKRSLLWQPAVAMLDRTGGTLAVDHVMANEITSLGGFGGGGGDGWGSILADPSFVDPAHGDYTLRVSSPAIDMAQAVSGDDRDAFGNPRDQDLPHTDADQGARDLGAYERQSLQPMVLNGDFDFSDLRLWSWFGGTWDGTQNATGDAGSGSWTLATSGLTYRDVDVGQQCVPLPGPGRYLMNGWGRGGGSTIQARDYAVLAWEYRRNGGDDCSADAADASGELTLGHGTSWGHPTQPAAIEATPADFVSGRPSITLRLIARDGSPTNVGGPISAWFDGITLDVEEGDVIFADGFE